MRFWTLAELVEKIELDLDMQEETFVSPAELVGYINDAIDDAEGLIHNLNEDYFLAKDSSTTLAQGTDEYELPAEIFANKIREIYCISGESYHVVKRARNQQKFYAYRAARTGTGAGGDYVYFLLNQTAGSPCILLSPVPATAGATLEIWHIRNANRLSADADVCDIPEFMSYIFAFVKERVYFKEGHPMYQAALAELGRERDDMTVTLQEMTPDAENEIQPDLSYYEDHN
jgi:hypothetical protein